LKQQYPPGTLINFVRFDDKNYLIKNGKESSYAGFRSAVQNPKDFLEPGFPLLEPKLSGRGLESFRNPSDFESRILMTGGSPYQRTKAFWEGSGIRPKSFGFRIADSDDRRFPLSKNQSFLGGGKGSGILSKSFGFRIADSDDLRFPLLEPKLSPQ
jgi:hypothetical protein